MSSKNEGGGGGEVGGGSAPTGGSTKVVEYSGQSKKCFFEIGIGGEVIGKIVMELRPDVVRRLWL